MSKQMHILLIVTAVSLVLLVACGGEPSPTATQPPTPLPPLPATAVPEATVAPERETPEATATAVETPEEPVTITWWTEPIGGDERRAFEKHVIEGFNAAHPGIVLEVNIIADLDRVTRTAVQGGAGPDIIQSPGPAFMVNYVDAGHVLPLDDYAQAYGWADTIYPWAVDSGRMDGQLYSLPLTYETMVLFYNTTLFDEMGWSLPADRAELEALAQEAADTGILAFAHGNASWRAANEWYVTIFYNNYAGSQAVYEALTGQRRWDDPLFVEAIQLLKDYMDRGWFSGGREIYYTLLFADIWGALGDGSAAMQMVGTWGFLQARTYFEGTDNEWDWAPLPPLHDGVPADYALGIGSSLAINAGSANPDAAAQVLDWLYGDPQRVAQIISAAGGDVSVLAQALQMAAKRGQILYFAATLKDRVELDLDLVHYRELRLVGSHDSTIAHYETALALLKAGAVQVGPLISHRFPLEQIQEAFEFARKRTGIKVIVTNEGYPLNTFANV